jgi:hypothetical protein
MMQDAVIINRREIMQNITIEFNVKGFSGRGWKIRKWIAVRFLKAAAVAIGCNVDLTTDRAAEIERWRKAERDVSEAYVRLRAMIPGALNTPHAPSGEQVWKITEEALRRALTK